MPRLVCENADDLVGGLELNHKTRIDENVFLLVTGRRLRGEGVNRRIVDEIELDRRRIDAAATSSGSS